MSTAVLKSSVSDRDGNRLAPRPPMATRCEPSQRALSRARLSAYQQREARERRELEQALESLEWESNRRPIPELPAPARNPAPATAATGPDPLLTAAFIAGAIAGATAAMMLWGARP